MDQTQRHINPLSVHQGDIAALEVIRTVNEPPTGPELMELHTPGMDGLWADTLIHQFDPASEGINNIWCRPVMSVKPVANEALESPAQLWLLSKALTADGTGTTNPMCRESSSAVTHFISINDELTSRQQCAEEAGESRNLEVVGEFAAGITHHINQLLTVIRCNIQLLLSRNPGLEPESVNLLNQTLVGSDHAVHSIHQCVAFSRNQVLTFQELNLNLVVEGALTVFQRAVKADLEWEPHYGADLPSVLGDHILLIQAISNVLINALDAMPAGGRLLVSTERTVFTPSDLHRHHTAHPGEFVCLTILDTGCGIPPAILPRICEPFFSTKEVGDRCGLGLALVSGIVKQHQGWAEVSSLVGQGTTFKMFLPAISQPAVELEPNPTVLYAQTHQLAREPESDAQGNSIEEPETRRVVFSVNEVRNVPIMHWGINE